MRKSCLANNSMPMFCYILNKTKPERKGKRFELTFVGITIIVTMCYNSLSPQVFLVDVCCLVRIFTIYTIKIRKKWKEVKDKLKMNKFFFPKSPQLNLWVNELLNIKNFRWKVLSQVKKFYHSIIET